MSPSPGHPRQAYVQGVLAALNARDMERVIELTDPDVEFRSLIAASQGRVFRGLAGMREWQEENDSTLDGYRVELEAIHDAGDDRIVVILWVRGAGKASGIPIDQRVGQIWTWRDGRPWRNEVFGDPAEAFRAAGLNPDAA